MFIKNVMGFLAIALLSACATPYFGYSESEWNKLTELEQYTIKAEHKAIIASRSELEHQDTIDNFKQTIIDRGGGVRKNEQF